MDKKPKKAKMAANEFSSPPTVTTEEIVAFIAGVVAFFINVVLPMITFWWRFACLVLFLILIADICLRSRRVIDRVHSPDWRIVLSILVLASTIALLWNPMRRQYMQEHLPPSFPFIIGAPLGENDSPVWVTFINHYGSNPAYNCDLDFYDLDRQNVKHNWLVEHPNYSFPPPGLAGESQRHFHIPEADPLGAAENFLWTPLDANHQHYSVEIICRDGRFHEEWEVTRIDGVLRTEIKIERPTLGSSGIQNFEHVFACTDPEFSGAPLASTMPNVNPQRPINPGWKPNHVFGLPVVILAPNNNFYVARAKNSHLGCWDVLTEHLGDACLPLTLPAQDPIMALAVLIYGFIVLVLPLYYLFALWIMGVPLNP